MRVAHNKTHGMAGSPLYLVWSAMRNRCYNPRVKGYENYGGRGIRVCDRWLGLNGFSHFMHDMGPREDGMTIERRDNNGNYESSNCYWATRRVQSLNKRNNRSLTANGRTQTLGEWAKELGVNHTAIVYRLNAGWTEEEAVTKPKPERANAKLTTKDAIEILALSTAMSMRALAVKFGVCHKSIMNIVHGVNFKDVPRPTIA